MYGSCDSIRSRNEFISHFSIRKGRRQWTNRHKYALRLWNGVYRVCVNTRLRESRVEQSPVSFICPACGCASSSRCWHSDSAAPKSKLIPFFNWTDGNTKDYLCCVTRTARERENKFCYPLATTVCEIEIQDAKKNRKFRNRSILENKYI